MESYTSTIRYGNTMNKEEFNDLEFIKDLKEVIIKEIRLYSTEMYFAGLQVFYKFNDMLITPGSHCVVDIESIDDSEKWITYKGNKIKESVLTLDDDEYITELNVRSGWIVDCIELVTNKGNSISSGGKGGNPNKYKKSGYKLVAFSGSHTSEDKREKDWDTINHLIGYFGKA